MQINPLEIVSRGILKGYDEKDGIQQIGIDLRSDETFIIESKGFKNFQLIEKFDMMDTWGLFKIRSSYSRNGIFESSGFFDPGFKGTGAITLYNMSDEPLHIKKGDRVGQMAFLTSNPATMYDGAYQNNDNTESQFNK